MRKVVAILLAGGVGSRLNILVQYRAKPAVPFGGIYRIIDFTLSNIANCGLTRVAVLTQYKPLSLMDHIGDGSAWDLAGRTRGISILPPKTGEKDWDWYKGTADAVRQNLSFVASGQYSEVLILSGDHIYCMDYWPLVQSHRDRGAQVTIGMLPVPWEETRHFGTGTIDGQNRIVDWEEKSPKARSNLASMGIYVFDRAYLVQSLSETRDEDFGKQIIPKALGETSVYAHIFEGYWRDVGTIQAYWDANMDLLKPESGLTPEICGIRTNQIAEGLPYDRPPAKVSASACPVNSAISPGCIISGGVQNSILSPGVVIEEGALVKDSIIMHDCLIRRGTRVERSIVDKEVRIGEGSIVGSGNTGITNARFPDHVYSGLTLIGKKATIPPKARIGTNCIIYPEVKESDFPDLELKDGETVESRG
ncbi:MAG: Glucose-1-phosphate adenylyltransferase [Syntrophorhabdaceae bacterium PtaU1.Bin034]|nr:MAG: Glucose-1-phosphate adenylyltransferase [Syntrophorhabdaceae bacterium PtaU1.Bin034]